MRYFIVVGEASADLHASRLITALRERDPEAEFAFMGGDFMAQAAERSPLVHYRDVAFMGFGPVLRHLGTIRRAGRMLQQAIVDFAPDVVIPVDFAGFNFRYILPFVKKHLSCPIVYYIAPKLWAWKQWRIKALRRYTDLVLCILPFEQAYFAARGVRSIYVGNPCVDATLDIRRSEPIRPQIALLAGSRRQELRGNLSSMIEATTALAADYSIVLAGAPGLTPEDYAPYLRGHEHIELRMGDTYHILSQSRAALVTSGTATLETALIGTPQIVLYRMGGGCHLRWIFDHFFAVPYISLVNLILGRRAVPELIGSEVQATHIAELLQPLLANSPERAAQLSSIDELRHTLGSERTSVLAADALLAYLSSTDQPSQR